MQRPDPLMFLTPGFLAVLAVVAVLSLLLAFLAARGSRFAGWVFLFGGAGVAAFLASRFFTGGGISGSNATQILMGLAAVIAIAFGAAIGAIAGRLSGGGDARRAAAGKP